MTSLGVSATKVWNFLHWTIVVRISPPLSSLWWSVSRSGGMVVQRPAPWALAALCVGRPYILASIFGLGLAIHSGARAVSTQSGRRLSWLVTHRKGPGYLGDGQPQPQPQYSSHTRLQKRAYPSNRWDTDSERGIQAHNQRPPWSTKPWYHRDGQV
jgi:hypothetical protein